MMARSWAVWSQRGYRRRRNLVRRTTCELPGELPGCALRPPADELWHRLALELLSEHRAEFVPYLLAAQLADLLDERIAPLRDHVPGDGLRSLVVQLFPVDEHLAEVELEGRLHARVLEPSPEIPLRLGVR